MLRTASVNVAIILSPAFLSGCGDEGWQRLPSYQRPIDAWASVLPLHWFGIYPCASEKDDIILPLPVERCFKMLPARRYRGIWINEFEGSGFVEGASTLHDIQIAPENQPWLSWVDEKEPKGVKYGQLILIDFIGRQTAFAGGYGHMSGSTQEIVVDRLISARMLSQTADSPNA